ncbi:putative membrane associated protein [Chlamydia trachomatis]|nr:putative membrane associated protein [Chlamydia trachomatis]
MALVRMATLMNLSPSEAAILTTSFKTLPTEEADTLVNSFYTNKGDSLALSLRGLPTLVSELTRTARGNTNAEARSQQIYATTLSLVAKSLKAHKEMLNKQILSKEIVLDFSETAASCQGLDIFSENVAVQIHLNGTVSIHL